MNTETQKVDVLAYFNDRIDALEEKVKECEIEGDEFLKEVYAENAQESREARDAVAKMIDATARAIRYADSEPDGGEQVEVSRANIEQLRSALARVGGSS